MNHKLKKILSNGSKALLASEQRFEDIYNVIFSYGELTMTESSDGFRVRRQSYDQMRQRIEKASMALYARIGATHRFVGLEMENCEEWIVAFWAILRSGNKPYLVNCRHPQSLSNRLLKSMEVEYVVALERSKLEAKTLLFEDLKGECAFSPCFEDCFALPTSGTSLQETVCFYSGRQIASSILNAHSILKTSPRMAAHYHRALKQLAFLPFYHIFGLMAVLLWFTFFGRTIVFLRDYAPETILKTCRKHEVTHIFAVPLLWHTVEKQVWREVREQNMEEKFRRGLRFCTRLQNIFPHLGTRLSKRLMSRVTDRLFGRSIQFCISGGSYLRTSALELLNGLGYPLHNGFGMSEIGISSVELGSRPSARNRNSIGKPFDSVEYRLGEGNVLLVRGSSVCSKIMKNGEMLSVDGWLETGDIASCKDGNWYISGRMGDMVLGENGENINPETVERHFASDDALSLCVLGMGEGSEQELSMIIQISPYLPQEKLRGMLEEFYAVNESLPDAVRVRKFYLTHDAIAAASAVKVSRPALHRALDRGEVHLFTAAQALDAHRQDEALGCSKELFEKVRAIVARELELPEEKIGADDHIIFDLGASSLQYFSILSDLAENFSVPVPSDREEYRYTLKEFCQYIERQV